MRRIYPDRPLIRIPYRGFEVRRKPSDFSVQTLLHQAFEALVYTKSQPDKAMGLWLGRRSFKLTPI